MNYSEIFKLKKMLEEANIPHEFINRSISKFFTSYQICIPKDKPVKERIISVIEGMGTYGNEEDRLEIMGLLTPEEKKDNSVLGWLTAEEVFERIKTIMAAEKNFENKVKKFLKEYDCWTLKTWSNGVQRSGVPDLLVCCKGCFIGIELKAANGKPSELQLWNLQKIEESGGYAWLLYPNNFNSFADFITNLDDDFTRSANLIYSEQKGW